MSSHYAWYSPDRKTYSKLEQRERILHFLKSVKDSNDVELWDERFYLNKNPGIQTETADCYHRNIRYGIYQSVFGLREEIKYSMGMKPSDTKYTDVQYKKGQRAYTFTWHTFSAEDEAKVDLVIKRLAEQGFIRISKSGKTYTILATDEHENRKAEKQMRITYAAGKGFDFHIARKAPAPQYVKWFAGYDFMGSANWADSSENAARLEREEAEQIIKDLESAEG